MNIFRFLGDVSHLCSILILIHKIVTSRSCRGISFKTQLLYFIVFVTRYIDLFQPLNAYLILMKIFFITSTGYILYLIKVQYRYAYITHAYRTRHEADIDSIRLEWLLGGPAILALLFHYKFTFKEILWAYSIFLEAVAILPQMFLLQRLGEAETITTHYIFALGAYRALYILNWLYRYVFRYGHLTPVLFLSQSTTLIISHLWPVSSRRVCMVTFSTVCVWNLCAVYFNQVVKGKKFELPA